MNADHIPAFWGDMRKQFSLILILLLVLAVLGIFSGKGRTDFVSSEVRFSDTSRSGLSIVPASCPSSPHYSGECTEDGCATGYTLQNGRCVFTSCPSGYTLQSNFQGRQCVRTSCPSGFTLQGNNCIPPPSPAFVPFSGTSLSGSFTATGHLQVRPSLIRNGDTTQVYWNVANVSNCTVTGTNGDSWGGSSSPSSGQTSSVISARTVYTLACNALLGASPSTISESATVTVVPVFQEL